MGWDGQSTYQRTWRPLSIADASRYSVSWSRRNDARDRLDDLSFLHQKKAAEAALGRTVKDGEIKTRPQRGPLHTHYAAYPAARACIGLTAIAEFKTHASHINTLLQAAVKLPPRRLAGLDAKAAAQTSMFVLDAVTNRLCTDHLHRFEKLGAVESYRLFAAAMIDLRFTRLKDVILAAVTLGDLVCGLTKRDWMRQRMHPLTCRILDAMAPPCQRYEIASAKCAPEELPTAGATLAKELLEALVPFLPLAQEPQSETSERSDAIARELLKAWGGPPRVPIRSRHMEVPCDGDMLSKPLEGSEEPVPPSIDEPTPWRLKRDSAGSAGQSGQGADGQGASPAPDGQGEQDSRLEPPGPRSLEELKAQAMLRQASGMISKATGRSPWEDPRIDQVVQAMRTALFRPGAVESELATHRQKVTAYGSGRQGTIHAEVLPRCRDEHALRQVRQGAAPIEKKLRGYRWFGQRLEPTLGRLQPRGALDPRRLHQLAISQLLRRRWHARDVIDYRGRPVVVLAKDGSSSNTVSTTFAGKILTAAFLRIEKLARIQLFAADYSSDRTGPLVRWLYHLHKTPGRSSYDAVDAVASLPPQGQGGNEDVLSISYIMQEVFKSPAAAKQTVIVINVTDGRFNSPIQEFRSMIRKLREDHSLIYSLVILGDAPVDVPEANHTLRIPGPELQDPHQIAERIAGHVNVLVRNLRSTARSTHG